MSKRSQGSSLPPPPTATMRRGNGVLLSEPSVGLDTVYDGAADMKSTACLFGPRGGRWTTAQAYSGAFRSVTPRPWQRAPTREERACPPLGPGHYEPFGDTHTLSASISWQSRGRTGPVGYPFDAERRSPPFRSSVGRFHFAAKPSHKPVKEDCFMLASDARRDQLMRADFTDQMQRRLQNAVFQPRAFQPPMTAPQY